MTTKKSLEDILAWLAKKLADGEVPYNPIISDYGDPDRFIINAAVDGKAFVMCRGLELRDARLLATVVRWLPDILFEVHVLRAKKGVLEAQLTGMGQRNDDLEDDLTSANTYVGVISQQHADAQKLLVEAMEREDEDRDTITYLNDRICALLTEIEDAAERAAGADV